MEDTVVPERLTAVGLFSDLSVDELARVARASRFLRAPTGSVVIEEGDDISAKFFVILQGTVTVHRAGRHVADLQSGDFFGEVGTMTFAPRNATVIATTPVEAAVIMGWDLREMLDELPSLRMRLEAAVLERQPPV